MSQESWCVYIVFSSVGLVVCENPETAFEWASLNSILDPLPVKKFTVMEEGPKKRVPSTPA